MARGALPGQDVKPWRDPLVIAAMAASLFPDWDVAPGLLVGYEGVTFHRGATHSPAGVLLQAAVMTPIGLTLWRRLRAGLPRARLAVEPSFHALFATLFAAMGLHALADGLNPWGVAPWWPASRAGASWNLIHEGDWTFLLAAAACAATALVARPRTIAAVAALSFGAVILAKVDSREAARAMAAQQLGAAVSIYPTPRADCPWSALSKAGPRLRAACVAPSRGDGLRLVAEVSTAASALVEASKAAPAVADFLAKRRFPYAVLEPDGDGKAIVLWRDLRESILEDPDDPRFGLAVRFDSDGRIASVEHRWRLELVF